MKPLKRPWFRRGSNEGPVVTWVYVVPPWLLFIAALATAISLSTGGLLLSRRARRRGEEVTHNDVAGPIIATVGTMLAVISSFLLVTVWQEYDSAAATVVQEESAVADLFRISSHFSKPTSTELRFLMKRYVNDVVDREWPDMRLGRSSPLAQSAILDTIGVLSGYQSHSTSEATLQDHALNFATNIADSRRARLFANQQGIPVFFWIGNLLLAAITVAFCFLFRVRSLAAHLLMTSALATVIATIFVLIALFNYPFRGDSQIRPTVFLTLQQRMDGVVVNQSN
jgi:Protein of unknown function (DUF4239)